MLPERFMGWRVAVAVATVRARNTGIRQRVRRDGDRWSVRPTMPRGVGETCS